MQFGFTIHNDTLTYLGDFILKKGYSLDPDGVRCKTVVKLIKHFYDITLPRCDMKLTALINIFIWTWGPWINQSESAKSFIFKIHHDSCWCCYLILWGVIKRVIFCLGWTIISYKNYCKFSLKRFEALDKIPELGMYSLRLIMLSIPLPSILKWNIWEMCDSLNRFV